MTEVCLVKLLLDVAHRVRLEVDSNKTDKNWSTYQSSRPRSARLRCSDWSRVEVTWPEPKLSTTRLGSSFSFQKGTNKQRIHKGILMKWARNNFWVKYSDIHMYLWSNFGLGGFGSSPRWGSLCWVSKRDSLLAVLALYFCKLSRILKMLEAAWELD